MTDYDDTLMDRAARLPREVRPARDLWPGIEAGIRQTQAASAGSGARPLLLRVAAAVALMAVSSLVTWTVMRGQAVPTAPTMAAASFGDRHVLGPEFIQARNDLAARVALSLDRLSPETRTVVEGNLTEIRRSIAAINEALAQEPSSASLQQLLYSTYQQELTVMREISRLEQIGTEGVSI